MTNHPKSLQEALAMFDEKFDFRDDSSYEAKKSFLETVWHAGRESVVEEVQGIVEEMKVAGGNYNCGEEGCCPPPKHQIEKEDIEVQMGWNSAVNTVITKLSELKK